jgi:hypothetical protein
MQSNLEDTSVPPYDEFVLTLALSDLAGLFYENHDDRELVVNRNIVSLHAAGFSEPVIAAYNRLGDAIVHELADREAQKLVAAISKMIAEDKKRREAWRTTPVPGVERPGRSNRWSMSLEEFREKRRAAEQELINEATRKEATHKATCPTYRPSCAQIAERMGIDRETERIYRKREQVYWKLLDKWGREPTEAEIDNVVQPNRRKRNSTRAS